MYLGEYAAHLPGRPNNLETALAEALYLTSLERNGDVVTMSSYAPLLAKEGHTQWNPDLIYFNNTEVKPTVGYEVQKLFGLHAGDQYLPAVASCPITRKPSGTGSPGRWYATPKPRTWSSNWSTYCP
ncbi:alpha-L-arabinofuranosidase C-terminal domain-containing protein [Paraflavitalea speifideaquila]|uniref:alpha-L-arabinofuranosidase C-terminal domain-containing protein n=1 Tax=Paraflavitalea speifideaquila TaxID=3076558 RepID=UPI0028F09D1E|nr:alpha-L-arabinofuranosidase C-terminal domain-containing protein [Paraflavitalea speifideiaquila]